MRKEYLILFIMIGMVFFPSVTSAFIITATGFGGVTLDETADTTAGFSVTALFLFEGEFGRIWSNTTFSYSNFNVRLPMWIFSGLSDSGLSDKLWDWGVLPYFEGGMGAIEGDFMLASGVGVNIFIFLRVDYRHFFVFDGDDIDRVYTGIEIPLLIPSD